MAGCRATKADKERCKLQADGSGYCWARNPKNSEQVRRRASKGGRSRVGGEVKVYKQEVRDLIAAVENGGQDRADAAVMLQGYRLLKDFAEHERRAKETDELEARLEQLEQSREGGKR
jgi:hypothetical protein